MLLLVRAPGGLVSTNRFICWCIRTKASSRRWSNSSPLNFRRPGWTGKRSRKSAFLMFFIKGVTSFPRRMGMTNNANYGRRAISAVIRHGNARSLRVVRKCECGPNDGDAPGGNADPGGGATRPGTGSEQGLRCHRVDRPAAPRRERRVGQEVLSCATAPGIPP